ncbi:MAG: hypothetical protein P8O16_12070 [Algoriphagus sp.]|uniref:hypothetical protein n=1 Tax=Algoriphagus sp. TaxID=1872435 RepID=UPI002622E8C8|nr:hypothetical protein [Algoriphagus sp.]MDG1278010.1 hypothetical protein [Algoriphagus sp.]
MFRINVLLLVFLPLFGFAQQEEKGIILSPDLHFRTFWMSTNYPSDFKNDFALGSSLNLGAKARVQKFEFQVGYRVFANLWSSDLASPDPLTGQPNRYEAGLFDLLNPRDKFFGKLETLSISYQRSNWGASLGRMGINSSWINAQDGRLSPTAIEGLHTWFSTSDDWKFDVWAISRISIRGSSEWFGVGESMGILPVGRDINGKPAAYFGNTDSDWIGIFELSRKWKILSASFSNTLVENVSNTAWVSADRNFEKKNVTWITGIQAGYQIGIGDGGNPDLALAYKNPKDKNWAISGRFGWKKGLWTSHLSYTRVGGDGRWLSPREWGKDAWYTFIPRERNEGYQSLDAVTGYIERQFINQRLIAYLNVGFHWLPDLDYAIANKYNFPSYRQINLGLKYKPENIKGLDFHLIVMNKEALGKEQLKPNQRYNKVEMIHFNLIGNWRFNQ